MIENKDTETTSTDAAELESGQSPEPANHVSPAPGEVEIVQPRQGILRTYDVTDGLPTGIQCGLQDQRGYLWLTSWIESVACRYDGAEFTMYTTDDGLANGGVASFLGDRQGRLWFGMDYGGVFCFDGQRFINYTTEAGALNSGPRGRRFESAQAYHINPVIVWLHRVFPFPPILTACHICALEKLRTRG